MYYIIYNIIYICMFMYIPVTLVFPEPLHASRPIYEGQLMTDRNLAGILCCQSWKRAQKQE